MPSTYSRRDVLRVCGVAFGLGTAGCIGDSSNENSSGGTTVTTTDSTTTHSPSTTSKRTTIAASTVSDKQAKERALTAEEAFLTKQLQNASCLTDWGTTPTTVSKRATVTKRTADGVYVEVTHPYWYSTEQSEADAGSNALYVVTVDGTERVRGENVSAPC